SYVDHQLVQIGFENADDHRYLQSVAAKYGIAFSRPGNGICHQVHLERFGKPGKTLVGSDSHTPTAGGIGMLGFGAGGMDVAMSMAGQPFNIKMPEIYNVVLTGNLKPWVSAKDIILEMLRRLTVKGGVGKAFEYTGPGIAGLSIPARSSITNMGTELGATTSIFPSDEITEAFLKAQHRENDYVELQPDKDAVYAGVIEINLSELDPLIAQPHMPDRVVKVSELEGKPIDQAFIGSCTNSSYLDLLKVSKLMKGLMVNPLVEMGLSPGSRQVFEMASRNGVIADLVQSGVRILEVGCTACGGGGLAPNSGGVSIRSSNRNFLGRSGTADGQVFLASSETVAASAIAGYFTTAEKYADSIAVID
ncbi:MAG: aconitate hydratase, partial [Spirochaetia bacterium]|nr:aconitate hydratase [Spirochaetia bacterium]